MKAAMNLEMPTAKEILGLQVLIETYTRNGQKIGPENSAMIVMKLIEENHLMRIREGRELFTLALAEIEGTQWKEIVLPTPKTDEDKKVKKIMDGYEKHTETLKNQFEYFFNEVFPNIDLGDKSK